MIDLCPVVKWSGIWIVVLKPDWRRPVYGPKCPVFKWFFKSLDFTIWIPDTHTVQYSDKSSIQVFVFRWLLYFAIQIPTVVCNSDPQCTPQQKNAWQQKNSDQGILLFAAFDCRIDDKVEEFFDGQNVDLLFAEELVHVGQVLAQELQGVGVIVFDRLRYVNDVSLSLVVQQVELALKIFRKKM